MAITTWCRASGHAVFNPWCAGNIEIDVKSNRRTKNDKPRKILTDPYRHDMYKVCQINSKMRKYVVEHCNCLLKYSSWAAGGALGVAAAALALTPRLLDRALPPHSFRHRYVGAFRFRFWVFGEWRDVVVDDRLPARAHCPHGDTVPVRAHCPHGDPVPARAHCLHGDKVPARTARQHCSHDFTLPLLEKAYAKLHGSYAALRDTSVARALQELSGGVVQSFSLRSQPRAMTLQVLQAAAPRSSLLVAHGPRGPRGARGARGLAPGRAYVLAGLARVREATLLLRLRAPAGAPWCGAWAPGSAEWAALAPHDRDILMSSTDSPDDFWISFDDFVDTFSQLELVHVGPDDWLLEPALQARRPWRAVLARRRWRAGFNAGGPPSAGTSPLTCGLAVCCHSWTHYLTATETTGANPQFLVQIPQSEGEDACKCHVVVAVTQHYEPGQSARSLLTVGFALYALRPGASAGAGVGARPLDAAHHGRARDVVAFCALAPGRYLLVPHARRAHVEGAFLLRVLTDRPADVWEVNDDNLIVRDVAADLRGPLDASTTAAELDAAALRLALRRHWRACLCAPPSLELCGALVALRDATLEGAMRAAELPALLALLAAWRAAWRRVAGAGRCGGARRRASSYWLRELLREAGVSASNKVLEALVLRFARGARLTHEAYVMALARLHVAHERFRSLDARLKCNPVSLEEMILMTIYS
ncbi:unnamed protein product [Spodoptera littoralis]|uniref:Calpain catalytic domain-containing protein n=1 Tax=Spodoptera littoralis TaxID=7109 RepID=A0A9P0I2Q3_SPOLI|nr:unnamed protein product [Spodoptera littoralis]CAH1638940.1 unnamed protein product [Spodoptera littoralis]